MSEALLKELYFAEFYLSGPTQLEYFAAGMADNKITIEMKLKQLHDVHDTKGWQYLERKANAHLNVLKKNKKMMILLNKYKAYLLTPSSFRSQFFYDIDSHLNDKKLALVMFYYSALGTKDSIERKTLWLRHTRHCLYLLQAIKLKSIFPDAAIKYNAMSVIIDDMTEKSLYYFSHDSHVTFQHGAYQIKHRPLYCHQDLKDFVSLKAVK
ncbi:hypothetical protein L0B53_16195 [Vibrio sp. SS-MA-C1-2]|uniref:hypothetical protein n=1 Tax=Vibrio sp. SS-MA-C1-2 TaxID=2908646 RepID=UPI001F16AD41|nr:hypothetical protein [Vibrio sp. SS-MA-C1-2]UJF18541.1 hypothetical protein L0B53_16195 [Vibrio sp. SS-MA-C1-2]